MLFKCIYTCKELPEVHFKKREHVVPACIGGTQRFERGMVCDEFNHEVSKAETEFSRMYPLIVLPRMMEGPPGRKKHKGVFSMGFLESEGLDFLQLGYVSDKQPIPIPQIIADIAVLQNKKAGTFRGVVVRQGDEQTLMEAIPKHFEHPKILWTDNPKNNGKLLLGYVKGQLYAGVSTDMQQEEVKRYIVQLKDMIQEKRLKPRLPETMEKVEEQVTHESCLAYNPLNVFRVFGKMAFNVLAFTQGQEFVLRKEFDKIRYAIVTGENIRKYVSLPESTASREIAQALHFENSEHFVFLKKEKDSLMGIVSLYGGMTSVAVIFSEAWKAPFTSCGFVCDWQHKTDLSLDDYIEKIIRKYGL